MGDRSAQTPPATSQGPHPLASAFREELARVNSEMPLLVLGVGNGRNLVPFVSAGIRVTAVDDNPERLDAARSQFADQSGVRWEIAAYTQLPGSAGAFRGVLSTHALLHGTRAKIRTVFSEMRRVLGPGAPIFVTLGSIHDARYGIGQAVDISSFAPLEGDEQGVPHVFFEEEAVRDLARGFEITSLEEVAADALAGRWAHGDDTAGRRHWVLIARKPR